MQIEIEHICSFSERFSKALKDKGLKQIDFAVLSGIPSVSISRYIRGKHLPSAIELSNIAAHLDVSMEWLLGKNENNNVNNWQARALAAEEELNAMKCVMRSLLEKK